VTNFDLPAFVCPHECVGQLQDALRVPSGAQEPLLAGTGRVWSDNDPDARRRRLAAACQAVSGALWRPSVRATVEGTRMLRWCDGSEYDPGQRGVTKVIFEEGLAMDVALRAMAEHPAARVAVVSAASAYQLGGGVLTGGRHVLEEALCMQTTLYASLARAKELARQKDLRDAHGQNIHIPEDGCVVHPDVEVLRAGTDTGYALLDTPRTLCAVISMAMPNKNYRLVGYDSISGPKYKNVVQSKFGAALRAAISCSVDMLVIPDCGCGVFQNDPRDVGMLLGKVLSKVDGRLQKVLLVGQRSFADAAIDAFGRRYAGDN